ncbi:MAG TPA: nuclear transport factor 2 family protein [Thermoleophilaceae bacterium]|nr:nuclear transport factor 2 family protein [Thermoleophilaceae bacterium]
MDSTAGPVGRGLDQVDSPNLRVVMTAYEVLGENGLEASLEHLLSHAHEDFEFTPYVGAGRVLRGADEVRAFFRGQIEGGTALVARATSFEECGDDVVVNGSLRVVRSSGGFAETQIRWTYRFRDGRLLEARGGPRRAA